MAPSLCIRWLGPAGVFTKQMESPLGIDASLIYVQFSDVVNQPSATSAQFSKFIPKCLSATSDILVILSYRWTLLRAMLQWSLHQYNTLITTHSTTAQLHGWPGYLLTGRISSD